MRTILTRGEKQKQIKRMRTILTSIIAAAAVLAMGTSAVQAADKKADATGTWTWSMPTGGRGGQGGGNANATPRKSTLKLKAEGETLTGTLSQPGFARRGEDGAAPAAAPAPVETKISDGKIKGDEISFSVTREVGGNSRTAKYSGKIDGDTIKGKMESPGRQGGDPVSRDWEAKREK
jgi:hypothetical protein